MVYKASLRSNTCYLGNMKLSGVSNSCEPDVDKYFIPGQVKIDNKWIAPDPLTADELKDLACRLEVDIEFKRELIMANHANMGGYDV